MHLTSTFIQGIVRILNCVKFSNPTERQRAYIGMRHLSEQTLRAAQAKCVHEMFRELNKRNLTLRTVTYLCAKLYHGKAEYKRRKEIERMVMSFKEDDARKKREKERRRLEYELRDGKHIAVLKEYKVTERFRTLARKEGEKEVKTQREIKHKKVKYLARK